MLKSTTPVATPRPPLRRPRPKGPTFTFWRAFQTSISTAFIIATLFTLWTPANLFFNKSYNEMMVVSQITPEVYIPTQSATSEPAAIRIGIIAGHKGSYNDPGAVCPKGFLSNGLENEAQVNERIATMVQQELKALGYNVDLLDEFDDRLTGYRATVLVSIHNDSCEYINDLATGFKVAPAIVKNPQPEKAEILTACLRQKYQARTGLSFHANTITPDMTYYHAFYEIDSATTAAIIETGFLNLDRIMLSEKTDVVARGVTEGILCYLEQLNLTTPTTP